MSVFNEIISKLNETAHRLLESKLLLSGVPVCIDAEQSHCVICGAIMTVKKTSFGTLVTNEHGMLNSWWPTLVCPNKCKTEDGHTITKRAETRDGLAMKSHKFGYDLEVEVGICRYLKHMQIDEIHEKFKAEGKEMSPSSISRYSRHFLNHLEMLHVVHLPDIAQKMAAEGGYYMLFDSTCEAGSGSLFTVLAGWRNWVVGSWRQSTENAKEMLPHVEYLVKTLGAPLAIMKDLSNQGQYVAEEIIKAYPDAEIRIFACHFHFVQDIGKDMLHGDHNDLKSYIGYTKTELARLIRDTRGKVTDDQASVARTVESWLSNPDSIVFTMNSDAVAIVRYLSQWVLDCSQDGDDGRFPFELPHLLFYDRVVRMSKISKTLIKANKTNERSVAYNLLLRLCKITTILAKDRFVKGIVDSLRSKNDLFIKLRSALHLEKKAVIEDTCSSDEKRIEFQKKAKNDFAAYISELRGMLLSDKTEVSVKIAARIIITHVDKYNDELWGHDILVCDLSGNTSMRVADRTNNLCEQLFAIIKSSMRRRSGRKNLFWDLTIRPAATSLVENLKDEAYLRIVCGGSLSNLSKLFTDLENNPPFNLGEQMEAYRKSVNMVFDSGRLPRSDVKIIRSDVFKTKVVGIEANCI